MKTVLVANRGEIALRVFRTARRMGLRTVAVYSDADAQAPHVRAADVAVCIGPAPAPESYLRRDAVIEAARSTQAQLVHPGYGFLAEDDRFAEDCERAGLLFVGPPSHVLKAVGDKAAARAIAQRAGVPLLPAYAGDDQSDGALAQAAERVGYPVIVKPSAGGGGKGMAVVRAPRDLHDALASARRIARAAFDDDHVILERYLEAPRHVEVQVFADTHGNVIHLGERDCSLQRRHQKILEESPAPNLDAAIRERLHAAAVAFAREAGYVGAGTCEFLVSGSGHIGFIEMNARLQVEHPVTEMVTSLDLVELQLRVAQGEALPFDRAPAPTGHAIEVRVYAEDPDAGFLPQAGRIEHVSWPPDVRVDSGIEEGTVVPPFYDPLLAKIVVHGPGRSDALRGLHHALAATQILGPRTNLAFLDAVTRDDTVVDGNVTTDWVEGAYEGWHAPDRIDRATAVAAAAEVDQILGGRSSDPWDRLGSWRAGNDSPVAHVVFVRDGGDVVVAVRGTGPYTVDDLVLQRDATCHGWLADDVRAAAARTDGAWLVWCGGQHEIVLGPALRRLAGAGPAHLDAPLPGQVVSVRVRAGQSVNEGEELVVLEAMKMEHAIRAPADGVVAAVLCAQGDQVDRGQALVDFEPV